MRNKKQRQIAEINVVPFIDIMLVLLVVFMITAPLLSQGVNVDMPQAKSKPLASKNNMPIIVSIDSQGRYFLNTESQPEHAITPMALMTHVAAQVQLAKRSGTQRHVYVKADKNVVYDKVMQAMVRLQKAGVENVGLMTNPV